MASEIKDEVTQSIIIGREKKKKEVEVFPGGLLDKDPALSLLWHRYDP